MTKSAVAFFKPGWYGKKAVTQNNCITPYGDFLYIDESGFKLGVKAMCNLAIEYMEMDARKKR